MEKDLRVQTKTPLYVIHVSAERKKNPKVKIPHLISTLKNSPAVRGFSPTWTECLEPKDGLYN